MADSLIPEGTFILIPASDRRFVDAVRAEYHIAKAYEGVLDQADDMENLDDDAVERLNHAKERHEAAAEVLAKTLALVCNNTDGHRSKMNHPLAVKDIAAGECRYCKAKIMVVEGA